MKQTFDSIHIASLSGSAVFVRHVPSKSEPAKGKPFHRTYTHISLPFYIAADKSIDAIFSTSLGTLKSNTSQTGILLLKCN